MREVAPAPRPVDGQRSDGIAIQPAPIPVAPEPRAKPDAGKVEFINVLETPERKLNNSTGTAEVLELNGKDRLVLTGKGRTIAIGPRGKQLLEEYKPTDPNAPVFPTADGTAYTVSGYRQGVERACLKAGVAAWSPNQIRNTFATEARRLFGLEGAQCALGHSKADSTQI